MKTFQVTDLETGESYLVNYEPHFFIGRILNFDLYDEGIYHLSYYNGFLVMIKIYDKFDLIRILERGFIFMVRLRENEKKTIFCYIYSNKIEFYIAENSKNPKLVKVVDIDIGSIISILSSYFYAEHLLDLLEES
jgi:hypothetical protein